MTRVEQRRAGLFVLIIVWALVMMGERLTHSTPWIVAGGILTLALGVALILQADDNAAWLVERARRRGDAGDPWPALTRTVYVLWNLALGSVGVGVGVMSLLMAAGRDTAFWFTLCLALPPSVGLATFVAALLWRRLHPPG